MKNIQSILATLLLFLTPQIRSQTLGPESMGTSPSTTTIAAHETANAFDLDQLTYSGTGDMRNTAASSGYSGASGLGNAYINAANETFIMGGLNITTNCTSLSIDFGVRKNTNAEDGTNLSVSYSTTGSGGPWTEIGSPSLPTGSGTVGWHYANVTLSGNPGNVIKAIRFIMNGGSEFRIDDVKLTGSGSGCELPIELIGIKVISKKSALEIKFSTATEIENDYFSIQRSPNGRDYTEIGQVKGAGTSYEPHDYTFTDEHPLQGKNYYRLKQVDFDGKYSYSPVVTTTFGKASLMTLAPVPATETLRIQLEKPTKDDGLWQVFDMNGRLLLSGEMLAETTEQAVHIAELPEGAYALRLTVGQEVMVEQFRKQR